MLVLGGLFLLWAGCARCTSSAPPPTATTTARPPTDPAAITRAGSSAAGVTPRRVGDARERDRQGVVRLTGAGRASLRWARRRRRPALAVSAPRAHGPSRPEEQQQWPSPTAVRSSAARRADRRGARARRRRRAVRGLRGPARRRRRPVRAAARRWPASTPCWCAAPPRSTPRRWPRPTAQGGRPRRHRPGQRRRHGGHRPRRAWWSTRRRPTSSAPPSTPSRCCSPSPATCRPRTPPAGRGSGSGREFTGVELAEKTVGIVGPRPDRRAGRPAAVRVRRPPDRLRPVRAAGPGRADRASGWSAWTSCCARATSSPSTCRRRRRRSA